MNGKPIAFMGVLHSPNKILNLKRVSRIVVLPDYQGIGIGYAFIKFMAEWYAKIGMVLSIATSAKNFIHKLNKSKEFKCVRYSVTSPDKMQPNTVRDRKLGAFMYVGARKKMSGSCLSMTNTRAKKPKRVKI